MANKYIERDVVTGVMTEIEGLDTSAGAGDAGKIPALDAAGLIDLSMLPANIGKTQFNVVAGVAGLIAGDLVYLADVAGTVKAFKATAGAGGDACSAFAAAAAVLVDDPVTVLFEGIIGGKIGLTPGAREYLSDVTPGDTVEAPVVGSLKFHQYIGRAVSPTEISFEPSEAIKLA